jgi:hypothetical protein
VIYGERQATGIEHERIGDEAGRQPAQRRDFVGGQPRGLADEQRVHVGKQRGERLDELRRRGDLASERLQLGDGVEALPLQLAESARDGRPDRHGVGGERLAGERLHQQEPPRAVDGEHGRCMSIPTISVIGPRWAPLRDHPRFRQLAELERE